ncbi:YceG family protein [Bacillus cytotoxicus]|uniref:YceG family protein n=1 Tax=Bacillus cytotoxicus TaxID=580165 RepID=A0ACC6A4K9_9BACI|nr:YceG family protein [Bacillus cytotoxicus]
MFSRFTFHSQLLGGEEALKQFEVGLAKRPHYELTENSLHFSYIGCRILGVPNDTDEYYNQLFAYSQNEKITVLHEQNLNKVIPSEKLGDIQEVFSLHQQAANGLTINRLVAHLSGKRLLPEVDDPDIQHYIHTTFISILKLYEKQHNQSLKTEGFRRFLIDMIKLSENYVSKWFSQKDYKVQMPQIIWYGDASESRIYFLYFLTMLGCDVLYYHPEGKDGFETIDEEKRTFVISHPSRIAVEPFPDKKRERVATVAYQASKEIEQVLHHDNSLLYKPWQFRAYTPVARTLKTTYDELFIITKEKAFIRPTFFVENQHIYIPSLFAKVSGVSKNEKEYFQRLKTLTSYENSLLINQFPFTKEQKANFQFHYRDALNRSGKLDAQNIIQSHWWPHKRLPEGLQYGIAEAMIHTCESRLCKKIGNEKEQDTALYVFAQLSQIPPNILEQLEKFDYSQEVPKIVIFNNEKSGELTRSDAVIMLFLNQIGVDVLHFNPTGRNDIEQYIEAGAFDCHWLEEVSFDVEFHGSSSYKNLSNTLKGLFKPFL